MKPNKKYLIRVQAGEKFLTYTATIISINENFVTFEDKFGKIITYNLNQVVSFSEVEK